VASRSAQEALQERLSRSGRQAESVKPLHARVKQLQEELGRARAEAEELQEQLAAEKKKVRGCWGQQLGGPDGRQPCTRARAPALA
jgi:DNA anti-recombination protein RmuC